jgi:sugar lactone lactonase YvrE
MRALPLLMLALSLPAAALAQSLAASSAVDSAAVSPAPMSPDSAKAPVAGAGALDSLPLRLVPAGAPIVGHDGGAELSEPSGLAVDAFGRIYVSDAGLHRLQRYSPNGTWLGGAGTLGSDPGQLNRPGSVVLLGALRVALLDRGNLRVVTYDLFGKLEGTLIDLGDEQLVDEVGRIDPIALAADRGGAVVVLDQDRGRLLAFDFAGKYLRTIGGFGARPGSFRGLCGVAFAPNGELITVERAGARVQRLDAGGRVVTTWAFRASPGRAAFAIAVDDSSRIAIADEISGRLTLFDSSGRTLARLDGLASPRALAFAPGGALLVAEAGAGRVRRFELARPTTAAGRE